MKKLRETVLYVQVHLCLEVGLVLQSPRLRVFELLRQSCQIIFQARDLRHRLRQLRGVSSCGCDDSVRGGGHRHGVAAGIRSGIGSSSSGCCSSRGSILSSKISTSSGAIVPVAAAVETAAAAA